MQRELNNQGTMEELKVPSKSKQTRGRASALSERQRSLQRASGEADKDMGTYFFPMKSLEKENDSRLSRMSITSGMVKVSSRLARRRAQSHSSSTKILHMPSLRNTLLRSFTLGKSHDGMKELSLTENTPKAEWFIIERERSRKEYDFTLVSPHRAVAASVGELFGKHEVTDAAVFSRLHKLETYDFTEYEERIKTEFIKEVLPLMDSGKYQEIKVSLPLFYLVFEHCFPIGKLNMPDRDLRGTLDTIFKLCVLETELKVKLYDLHLLLLFFWCKFDDVKPTVNVANYLSLKKDFPSFHEPNLRDSFKERTRGNVFSTTSSKKTKQNTNKTGKKLSKLLRKKKNEQKLSSKEITMQQVFRLFDYGHNKCLTKTSFEKLVKTLLSSSLVEFLDDFLLGTEAFHAFVETESSGESMLFFKWIREKQEQNFEEVDIWSTELSIQEGMNAFEDFFHAESESAVNVSDHTKEAVHSSLNEEKEKGSSYIKLQIFEDAFKEIIDLMEADSFHRFKQKLGSPLSSCESEPKFVYADKVWQSLGLKPKSLLTEEDFMEWGADSAPIFKRVKQIKIIFEKVLSLL